jgi:Zn-dependent metalloprotease
MKHFNAKLIFALLVFSINVSLLNAQRHFYLNLSKQCLSAESALTKIQQEFEIDPNSHFKLINDTTDRLGMQHLTYKQYLYDFEIVGCMVLVHAKKVLFKA